MYADGLQVNLRHTTDYNSQQWAMYTLYLYIWLTKTNATNAYNMANMLMPTVDAEFSHTAPTVLGPYV